MATLQYYDDTYHGDTYHGYTYYGYTYYGYTYLGYTTTIIQGEWAAVDGLPSPLPARPRTRHVAGNPTQPSPPRKPPRALPPLPP